jgi:hypothetical protein
MRILPTAVALCSVLALPASVFATGSRQDPPLPMPSASAPTIVCGMTIVQGDSSLDPAIVHRLPANAPAALITVAPPPKCKR